MTRTLKAMFRASGVRNAHAHHFCHTLATEILIKGEIIRKHYAKWPPEYQRRTVDILSRVHATYTARENFELVSFLDTTDRLVPGVGLEPTLPLPEKGF